MTAIRFPTATELEQGYAIQMAEDLARAAHPRPPEPRDQDERAAPPPPLPKAYCPQCGKVFDYPTKGMSVLQRNAHQRRAHPAAAEAY